MPRVVTTYLVLEKKRGWPSGQARVVRTAANAPTLRAGQCAVKLRLQIPDEAFEPMLTAPEQVIEIGDVMRPSAQAVKP